MWAPQCPQLCHVSHPISLSLSPQTRRGSDSEKRSLDSRGEVAGSGRAIPIKQVGGGSVRRTQVTPSVLSVPSLLPVPRASC